MSQKLRRAASRQKLTRGSGSVRDVPGMSWCLALSKTFKSLRAWRMARSLSSEIS